jgi:hypothetical protein
LLLFINVIKRNWVKRGREVKVNLPREEIKREVLICCTLHNMVHYKHFNALFRVMARHGYPNQYTELHDFIIQSFEDLYNLGQSSVENMLTHSHTAPLLSHIKTVIKEYSNKRLGHREEDFRQYITVVVTKAVGFSQLLQSVLAGVFSSGDVEKAVRVLQFLRKGDKIAMYGLLAMPSTYQQEQEISAMVRVMVGKLQEYDATLGMPGLDSRLRVEVEKYIVGLL